MINGSPSHVALPLDSYTNHSIFSRKENLTPVAHTNSMVGHGPTTQVAS